MLADLLSGYTAHTQLTVVLAKELTATVCPFNRISLMFCFLQLVDLKAELYRKQEQFKQEKLGQENAGGVLKSKSKVKVQYLLFWDIFLPACKNYKERSLTNTSPCSCVET